MSLMTPPYIDKEQKVALSRVTAHIKRLYESSAINQGQQNPFTSKDDIEERFATLQDTAEVGSGSNSVMRLILPEPYKPANLTIPLEKLRKIHTKDLFIGDHHVGRYLKIRTASTPRRSELSIESTFEDEEGSYGIVRKYFQNEETRLEDQLPYESVLIVRNPFLWDTGHDVMIVRVDHPGDLMFCHSWDQMTANFVPSVWKGSSILKSMNVDQLVSLAELYSKNGENRAALARYNYAEQKLTEEQKVASIDICRLYFGRAQIYSKLQQRLLVALDLDTVLKVLPDHPEARHMRAVAYYHTGKYNKCREDVRRLLQKEPKNHMYADLNQRVHERLEEIKTGNYNWWRMRHMATNKVLSLDHANYTHPVRLKKTAKGRRVFTARDVRRGDILMVTKALAFVPSENSTSCLQIEVEPPEWYEKTFSLMDDGGYPSASYRSPDELKLVDIFHIEEVRLRNHITISNLPIQQHQAAGYIHTTKSPADRLATYNSGIWFLPSFLRHSCLPNAHRSVIGDMLIVRAGCDIPEGTKVTINASTPSNWEFPMTYFTCTCPVHAYEIDMHNPEPTTTEQKRMTLWREFTKDCHYLESIKTKPEDWIKVKIVELLFSMLAKLNEIQGTLPDQSKTPHLQLAHRYRYVAAAFYGCGQRRHSRCAYYKVLDCLGVEYFVFEKLDAVVWTNHGQCSEDLLHSYRDLASLAITRGIKKAWLNASIEIYEILYAERKSFEHVMCHIEFVEAKDQCPCLTEDNFGTVDERLLMKRLGILEDKSKGWVNTPDGEAIMDMMRHAAEKARRYGLDKEMTEKLAGPERVAGLVDSKAKERLTGCKEKRHQENKVKYR
ncbi:hypothetical protein H072_2680 [Dactylellina haptotyla CBS 200.50]|uniref:SET domain-containing protein n=1 Tax=Dactylellina haptotyla (strain CBS 200.50) TaxID=1284197 RepID=S8C6U0_DACHA|nr:hypothetical protein H072_2680 [Dactylellina haptotyla CBS 200.50]